MIIACQATYPWLEENVVVERKWICVLISLFEIYVRSFQEEEKKCCKQFSNNQAFDYVFTEW